MFKDTADGQTHSQNDGCGIEEHNQEQPKVETTTTADYLHVNPQENNEEVMKATSATWNFHADHVKEEKEISWRNLVMAVGGVIVFISLLALTLSSLALKNTRNITNEIDLLKTDTKNTLSYFKTKIESLASSTPRIPVTSNGQTINLTVTEAFGVVGRLINGLQIQLDSVSSTVNSRR